jgi:hypothetical protein
MSCGVLAIPRPEALRPQGGYVLRGRYKPEQNQSTLIPHYVLDALDHSKDEVISLAHNKLRNDLSTHEQVDRIPSKCDEQTFVPWQHGAGVKSTLH